MNKTLTTLAAALLAMPFVAHAASDTGPIVVDRNDSVFSIRVSGADLDLASPGGQNKMRGRVCSAVREVCQVAVPQGTTRVFEPFAMSECARDTRQAVEPRLAALFARAARGDKIASLDLKLARAAR